MIVLIRLFGRSLPWILPKRTAFTVNYQRDDAVDYICSKQDSGKDNEDNRGGLTRAVGEWTWTRPHTLLLPWPADKETKAKTINNAFVYLQGATNGYRRLWRLGQ